MVLFPFGPGRSDTEKHENQSKGIKSTTNLVVDYTPARRDSSETTMIPKKNYGRPGSYRDSHAVFLPPISQRAPGHTQTTGRLALVAGGRFEGVEDKPALHLVEGGGLQVECFK